MSMSQANAALVMDVYAETARLGITLTEAERVVDQSARRMGQKIDGSFAQVGNKIVKMLGGAVGAGLAVKVIDDALRKVADGIREGQGASQIGMAIAESVVASIKSIPVAGAITDIVEQTADAALGGPMALEAARKSAIAMQQAQQELQRAGETAMGELELAATEDPVLLARAERAREVARLRAIAERSVAGRVQMVNGREEELEPGIRARARDLVAKGLGIYDEKVRVATEERRKRDAERIAAEEERRIREQEEAYSRFIKGNTQEAILALEAQLQAAGTAAAPTRADRLAQLMAGMTGGIATADTALGAFTFATGDPAQISRDILENAHKQLATLERIEGIQREIAALQKGTGFN
jgi:hypothetical protein